MVNIQIKLNIEELIGSLHSLNALELEKLQKALSQLQNERGLEQAVEEGLEDIRQGKVHSHENVIREIKVKYNA